MSLKSFDASQRTLTLAASLLLTALLIAPASATAERLSTRLQEHSARGASLPPQLAVTWSWSPVGERIGGNGFEVEDLDGDGIREIIAVETGTGGYWYILEWDGTTYRPLWTSLPPADIRALAVAQVDADPALEVLVAAGTTLSIFDGADYSLEGSIELDVEPRSLLVEDIDGDGVVEVVAADEFDLYSYSVDTGIRELVRFGFGGLDLASCQIDLDPAFEIAIANGSLNAYLLDGSTGLVDWGVSGGFGDRVDCGDLNGDGFDDVVGVGGEMEAWDAFADSLLWSQPVGQVGAFVLADVESDPRPEVLYGFLQGSGGIHVLNQDGIESWTVGSSAGGVSAVAAGDADGDGVVEVLWGSGHFSSAEDFLWAADSTTHLVEWQSLSVRGPYLGLDWGDIDADGNDEYLVTSYKSESDGLYLVFDQTTGALEYVSSPTTGTNWAGLWGAQLVNSDSDPQQEICIPSSLVFDGRLICYDGLTHVEEWHFDLPTDHSFESLLAADINDDSLIELVGGVSGPDFTSFAIDPATGLEIWASEDLDVGASGLRSIAVGDVDGDSRTEVVGLALPSHVVVLDGATGEIQLAAPVDDVWSLLVTDIDQLGADEILVGTYGGLVQLVDPKTGNTTTVAGPFDGRVSAIGRGVFKGQSHYVIVVNGTLGLYPDLGAPPVTTLELGPEAAIWNSLIVIPHSWSDRILVNLDIGVAELSADGGTLFLDGFESGDLAAWDSVGSGG